MLKFISMRNAFSYDHRIPPHPQIHAPNRSLLTYLIPPNERPNLKSKPMRSINSALHKDVSIRVLPKSVTAIEEGG